ncbi:bacteriophage holin family protein [Anoxybacillus sp. B7M1]|jgi:uncharacterized membrane protein|uniref:Holin n=1 Tax=Anoxybacteroides rupiense TaxID=311460 RepID=A0ABD5IW58_9BACL|nr:MULTISPECIES: holin [Anoxybacillus]ANB58750.1 bacteriophage holin family protein [Anoxybacillus sp. B2M1]ANB65201.1 bacteriophage holin family protein [Anoxybacillus sp. B7M1]KXG10206.1 hypothetical protein AT864_01767 [Anoxybacillus sp. P3H1B]MBB3907447.1 putative membrane protein [Anoxybacillus rupiensis]MBS2770450.1 holin [Anoxybacillus rupiensis]
MERFKNYGLWVALGSFILLALQTFGVDLDLGKYEQLYETLLGILVVAGIINNPSIGRGYLDKTDKKE